MVRGGVMALHEGLFGVVPHSNQCHGYAVGVMAMHARLFGLVPHVEGADETRQHGPEVSNEA